MAERATRIRGQRSEVGGWELAEAPPAARLAGLVRRYVGFVETSATPLRRREPPSGTAVLIVNFGASLEVGAPGRPAVVHAGSFVARMSELPATTAFSGTSTGVQVDFSPLGLHLFCGLALHELPDPAVGLTELLGEEGRLLTEVLAGAPDWESRFDLLDAVIERRVAAARPPTPSVEWAWRALEASAGTLEVGRLSERIGSSRRHLIAGFREQIGVPPKTAARILRFDRAARLVRDPRRDSLARIASAAGYHDQAHMTREFRALAGITPAAYRAAALPGYLGIPAAAGSDLEEVKSVQDPGESAP
jgi:AraC-like DNA-binding protein